MEAYDPEQTPDPSEWLALDETDRIALAVRFHEWARIDLPNLKVHAVIHCVVETQLAEEFAPTVNAFARLRQEGLSRHDAIHAIGSVLAEYLYNMFQSPEQNSSTIVNERYGKELDRLNVKRWRKRYAPKKNGG